MGQGLFIVLLFDETPYLMYYQKKYIKMKELILTTLNQTVGQFLAYLTQTYGNPENRKRNTEILIQRFGLDSEAKMKTLDEVGQLHGGLTRERVRQITEHGVNLLKKSEILVKTEPFFNNLKKEIESLGSIIPEDFLMNHFSADLLIQNQIRFCLNLHNDFCYFKDNDSYKDCWSIDDKFASNIYRSLNRFHLKLEDANVLEEKQAVKTFLSLAGEDTSPLKTRETLVWLSICKLIGKNQLNEWGKISSPFISPRGTPDYIYMALLKANEPLHFREISKKITTLFKVPAHEETCHNALISDGRFVLVGRGIYALKAWGYEEGHTLSVICEILKDSKGLSKQEIVKKVLEKRLIKKNTVEVGISNNIGKLFSKSAKGLISLKKKKKVTKN